MARIKVDLGFSRITRIQEFPQSYFLQQQARPEDTSALLDNFWRQKKTLFNSCGSFSSATTGSWRNSQMSTLPAAGSTAVPPPVGQVGRRGTPEMLREKVPVHLLDASHEPSLPVATPRVRRWTGGAPAANRCSARHGKAAAAPRLGWAEECGDAQVTLRAAVTWATRAC